MKARHLRHLLISTLCFLTAVSALAQPTLEKSVATATIATVSAPQSQSTQTIWDRVIVVGASASGGFTESEPFGGPKTARYRLSSYLDAALVAPHGPIHNFGNALFFVAPETEGKRQIATALKEKPTLLVGTDFLFWYCYGDYATDQERLQLFERGLKLLETVDCPVVVGNVPDASGVANRMLSVEEIPNMTVLAAVNKRLKEWAATHPKVMVLDLSSFMRAAMSNRALTVRDHTWLQGQTRALLQGDRLHPTGSGCAVMALAVMDAVVTSHPTVPAETIRWDADEVLRLGLMAAQTAKNPAPANVPISAEGK